MALIWSTCIAHVTRRLPLTWTWGLVPGGYRAGTANNAYRRAPVGHPRRQPVKISGVSNPWTVEQTKRPLTRVHLRCKGSISYFNVDGIVWFQKVPQGLGSDGVQDINLVSWVGSLVPARTEKEFVDVAKKWAGKALSHKSVGVFSHDKCLGELHGRPQKSSLL